MEDHPLSDKQVREKLIARGASALTDTELLSILLHGSGPGGPATELAGRLLDRFEGSLARMGRCSLAELRSAESLGIARAAVLSAALELGRRLRAEQSRSLDQVQTDRDVIEMFRPLIAELPYEEFWALYLNSSNRVLDRVRISQGGVSATVVDHRLIVKRAVEKLAHAVILVHNHPSGSELPSEEDRTVTERVAQAVSLFDIALLDHIIVTPSPCYSFRNEGFFDGRD